MVKIAGYQPAIFSYKNCENWAGYQPPIFWLQKSEILQPDRLVDLVFERKTGTEPTGKTAG